MVEHWASILKGNLIYPGHSKSVLSATQTICTYKTTRAALQIQALQRISTKAEQRVSLVSCGEKCKYLKYTHCVCYRIITMNPIRSIDTRCMNYTRQVAPRRRSYAIDNLHNRLKDELGSDNEIFYYS